MSRPTQYRLARVFPLAILALALSLPDRALAVTPTPTPTPQPTGGAVHSFPVDNYAQLPWPLPNMPTFPPTTPSPTLYAATAAHATDYADTVGTATAQIGQFTGPISQISTPVAAMVGSASTPNAGDIDTGVTVGGSSVSFSEFAANFADDVGPVVGSGVAFFEGLIELGAYSPWLGGLVVGLIVGVVIGAFIELMIPIIKAGSWLLSTIGKIALIARLVAFFLG